MSTPAELFQRIGQEALRNKLLNHPIVERLRNNPNWKPAADAAPDPILVINERPGHAATAASLSPRTNAAGSRMSLKLRSNKVNSIGSRSLHRPQKVHGSFL